MTRTLDGLIATIADGFRAPRLQAQLEELEAKRSTLEAALSVPAPPAPPRLHPNLAETYRQRVAELAGVLTQDNAAAASWRRFCNWQLVPEIPNAPAMRGRWRRKSSWLRGQETTDS